MKARKKEPNFEQALAELEQLVERMEDGELSLEDSIKTYERGTSLSRTALKALDDAEQRIEILSEREGEVRPQPFEPEDA